MHTMLGWPNHGIHSLSVLLHDVYMVLSSLRDFCTKSITHFYEGMDNKLLRHLFDLWSEAQSLDAQCNFTFIQFGKKRSVHNISRPSNVCIHIMEQNVFFKFCGWIWHVYIYSSYERDICSLFSIKALKLYWIGHAVRHI